MDKKINGISEIIDNIKLIIFNAWIDKFLEQTNKKRVKEIRTIIHMQILWIINITFLSLNYPILTISVFYIAIYGLKMSIAVPTALAILKILNSLKSSANSLPLFVGEFLEFSVSIKRIQDFLCCNEIEKDAVNHEKNSLSNTSIRISNSNFFWGFDKKIKKKTMKKIAKQAIKKRITEVGPILLSFKI